MIDKCSYIERAEIDEAKYNACIENAKNGLVYACSWYLDAVCDHWDCLILDDYHVVMPLPRRTKLGIDYIYLPCWIQQLGIFYSKELSAEIVEAFLEAIPKKFLLTEIFFNAHNDFYPVNQIERTNYTLELKQPYEALKRGYTKGRHSSITLAKNQGLVCQESFDIDLLIELHQSNYGDDRARSREDLRRLKELFTQILVCKRGKLILVYKNEQVLGGGLFTMQAGRIFYLFSAVSKAGREQQAMSFLLDSLIKEYAETANVLDFEGSLVPGIASFFRSFGAEKERYFHFKRIRIPFFGGGKKEIQTRRK